MVYASDRIIGILTDKKVGYAIKADFDVGTFEARLPIDEPSLLAACRTALDRSCAVPTDQIRAFPDHLETVRRLKLWVETLPALDGRKSVYKVWQKWNSFTLRVMIRATRSSHGARFGFRDSPP